MRSILLVNRMGIGDVVLTTPLAQLIKEYANIRVGMVVSPKVTDIIQNHPYIDDVFSWEKKQATDILQKIRAKKYNEAIIVDERINSTFIALRAGCKLLNYGWEMTIGNKRLFTRNQYDKQAVLDYSSYIRLLDHTLPVACRKPILGAPSPTSQEKILKWLKINNPYNKKLVLMIPRGIADNKNWMPAYFGAVNSYLEQRAAITVYLGSNYDKEYIDSIAGPKINAAGIFSLREVGVLAHHAAFSIAPCTGTMHIISTAGKPVIALYGPTQPERWAPDNAIIARADLPCIPCCRLDCRNTTYKKCMKDIKAQDVIAIIEQSALL